ncbi:hypothetical protein [Nonomuraea sp. JJY05]|uniref:hypothetical protein n=1 Tax=Nonomuraea sp. JJY05 TaxID=3350255 RepID=UPI00373E0EDD
MSNLLKIEDLPAGVSELVGEELEVVAGMPMADMKPGSGYFCSSTWGNPSADCVNR